MTSSTSHSLAAGDRGPDARSNHSSSGSSSQVAIVFEGGSLADLPHHHLDSRSVAETIANSVGSVTMLPKEAFLKSFTFVKPEKVSNGNGNNNSNHGINNDESETDEIDVTDITFANPKQERGFMFRSSQRLPVSSVSGIFALSRISQGDYLKTVNGKRVGPSMMKPELVTSWMQECLEQDGYLSISTKNKEEGMEDILVHATIIKPRPGMKYKDLGMVVWLWGYLVIKSINKDSIFQHTVLKENDNIVSVNEILCEEMKPEQFAEVIDALPKEITITVLRRKERITGKFG